MSAPASVHQEARRRAALIVERHHAPDPARCVAAVKLLLTYRSPATLVTAGSVQPLTSAIDACTTPAPPDQETARPSRGTADSGSPTRRL